MDSSHFNPVYIILNREMADWETTLQEAGNKLVAVDFTATWCGPCKNIAPEFEKLSESHKDVVFVKDIAQKYEVNCMPTFKFFKNGKVVHEFSGADVKKLKDAINSNK